MKLPLTNNRECNELTAASSFGARCPRHFQSGFNPQHLHKISPLQEQNLSYKEQRIIILN